MKKVFNAIIYVVIICLLGCNSSIKEDRALPYRFASKEEAIKYYLSNDEYFNSFSEYDIQYRSQSIDGNVESVKEYGAKQMLEFTDNEKEILSSAMDELETIIKDNGYHLPKIDEIVFIKSTQKEEGGSVAYTHGTQIYMNNIIPIYLRTSKENHEKGLYVLAHEIFHCLTRCNKDFRSDIYKLINFTVNDKDFEIADEVKRITISNPDVEHHDAYATFNINNKDKDCYMLNISAKPFEKPGDEYSTYYKFILVPVNKEADDKDYYIIDEAKDYWNVFGENTKYVADPEECMADNFGYALSYGLNGSIKYNNPEIIEGIIDILKNNKY